MEPCNDVLEEVSQKSTSRPTKRLRKRYNNADKLKIMAYAEKHGKLVATKHFRVNYGILQTWIRQRAQIMISNPLKYTNRRSKRRAFNRSGNQPKSNPVKTNSPMKKQWTSMNIDNNPESLCFICCASLCVNDQVSESVSDFVGESKTPTQSQDSQIRDTLPVLDVLIDMFSIQLEKSKAITMSTKISFCVSCSNLITKWGALLRELFNLQTMMEKYFCQMDNLKKGVEEMFEEFNSGSVGEKLHAGLTESDSQDGLPTDLLEIKMEPPDAEIEQSVPSNCFPNSNDSSPKVCTTGKFRKLPITRDNEEQSGSSEVCSDRHVGNDNSSANSDSDHRVDANHASNERVAGEIQDRVPELEQTTGQKINHNTGNKARLRKRRSCVILETESEDSDCTINAKKDSDTNRKRGSKVPKKQRKLRIEGGSSRRKKRGRPPKPQLLNVAPEGLESEMPGETASKKLDLRLRLIEFPDGRMFIRFIEVFRTDDKYKCSLCPEKIFQSLLELRWHLVETHADILDQYKGKRCVGPRKKRRTVKTLNLGVVPSIDPIKVGDKFQCSICKGTLYSSQASLGTHIRYVHYGVKTFECTLCGMKLIGKGRLNVHMKCHVPAKAAICEICGRSFKTDNSLTKHIRSIHNQNGGKKFPCEVCGKEFLFKSDCEIHVRSHTGEKPFQCELCAQTFKQRALLSKHLVVAHGQNPRYTCSKCGAMFSNPGLLHTHVAVYHQTQNDNPQPQESIADSCVERCNTLQTPKDSQLNTPPNYFLNTPGVQPYPPLEKQNQY